MNMTRHAGILIVLVMLPALAACRSQRVPDAPDAPGFPGIPGIPMDAAQAPTLPGVTVATRRVRSAAEIRFQRATGMTSSAADIVYVADGAANTIRSFQLGSEGTGSEGVSEVLRIGTTGSGAAEFNGLSDVAVLSGMSIVASDRGNGRIQRFDRDGALVELFPLNPGRDAPGPVFSPNAAQGVTGWSEPVAIAVAPNDDLFMVDIRAPGLFRTDRRRERLEKIGADVLIQPVDVVVSSGRLQVLDASEGIVVFDMLGSHIRTVRVENLSRLTGLSLMSDGRLLGLESSSAVLFDDRLAPTRRLLFRVDAPVSDVIQRGDLLYVLTETTLHVGVLTDW